PTHWNGRWYIHTNADDALDFKVMSCAENATARANWIDVIPHQPGRFITGLSATKGFLVRAERDNALPRIVIRRTNGDEHAIALDEEAYNLELVGSYEFETTTQRYIYDSPTTPLQWFDYDMASGERTLRKTQEIPSGHDPQKYEARRLFATTADGKR